MLPLARGRSSWFAAGCLAFAILLLCGPDARVQAQCHHRCSGHGECTPDNQCACHNGYFGPWCEKRRCPYGTAWVDLPSAPDIAHAPAECSNMGNCDYRTGICRCLQGFEGPSCNRMSCPNRCSGHGRCMTLAEAASSFDGQALNRSITYTDWDADMVRGCVCDPGFEGYDCSERPCEVGRDPRAFQGKSETVVLRCQCGPTCSGDFRLTMRGRTSAPISPSADNRTVGLAVLALQPVNTFSDRDPASVLSVSVGGAQVCGTSSEVETRITFKTHDGAMPPMAVSSMLQGDDVALYMQTLQYVNCSCGSGCAGFVAFQLDGVETPELPASVSSAALEDALRALPTLSGVDDISVTPTGLTDSLCPASSSEGGMRVEIKARFGNLPDLRPVVSLTESGSAGGNLSVSSNKGTTTLQQCNAMGRCNAKTGLCKCDSKYTFDATLGPCGVLKILSSQWTGLETCPGTVDLTLRPIEGKNPTYLYFTNKDRYANNMTTSGVYRQTLGLKEAPVMVLNLTGSDPGALALDLSQRMLYWVDRRYKQISRRSIESLFAFGVNDSVVYDPSDNGTLFVGNLSSAPNDLTLDLRFGQRYAYFSVPGEYSNSVDGVIMRANLDGAVVLQSIVTGLDHPTGIALDVRDDVMYFTDAGNASSSRIYRSGLDGAHLRAIASRRQNVSAPYGIALDLLNRKAYVLDTTLSGGGGHIVSFSMDANTTASGDTTYHTVASSSYAYQPLNESMAGPTALYTRQEPLSRPEHLLLDVEGKEIYYTDSASDVVRRVNFQGTRSSSVVFGSSYNPVGLAMDFGKGYPTTQEYYECYGHGQCLGFAGQFQCHCHKGYSGNCDIASCPMGRAWFDTPVGSKQAHRPAVCSNRGKCNVLSGQCTCHIGFEGPACDRLTCPGSTSKGASCGGHGQCLTMAQLGHKGLLPSGEVCGYGYGLNSANDSLWDAHMLRACHCDRFGYATRGPSSGSGHRSRVASWTGLDCGLRECPLGDDPFVSVANASGRGYEVQQLACWATSGTFTLTFKGRTTAPLAYNASLTEVAHALQSLPTLGRLQMNSASWSPFLCSSSATAVTNITLTSELGPQPLLQFNATGLWGFMEVLRLVNGTKERAECANHGTCDMDTGFCKCLPGYSSSNYEGEVGMWGDCGYIGERSTRYIKRVEVQVVPE